MPEVGDKVEVPGFDEGTVVERIKKEDLYPLWEDHPHQYVDDPTDTTDVYYAQICKVDGCGIGRLVRRK